MFTRSASLALSIGVVVHPDHAGYMLDSRNSTKCGAKLLKNLLYESDLLSHMITLGVVSMFDIQYTSNDVKRVSAYEILMKIYYHYLCTPTVINLCAMCSGGHLVGTRLPHKVW